MDIRTWWLDPEQIDATTVKVEELNTRVAKRGLQGRYEVRLGETRKQPVYDQTGCFGTINGIPHYMEQGRPVPCPLIGMQVEQEFIIEGDAPQLGGWKLLAILTWDEGVFIARTVPGFENMINAASVTEGWCDHCKINRQRNDTYLVANAETGERMQVGSSCIKDFLGHSVSPAMLRSLDEDLEEIERDFRARGWESTFPQYVIERAVVIARQEGGWVSREKAETEYRTSSSEILRMILFPASHKQREMAATTIPNDADLDEARKVFVWLASLTPDNNYLDSMQRLALADHVSIRNVGLLGSAVAAYHRATTEKIEWEARAKSEHIGTAGKREVFRLVLVGITWIEDNFNPYGGSKPLYIFKDQHGNLVKWFASREQRWPDPKYPGSSYMGHPWSEGDEVTVKATVKEHDEYKGIKQTVITRATQISEEKK